MNIFQPKTEAEVAQVIRETNRGLSIFGGGTRGVCERGGNSLETKGLSGIIDYQPGALTMIAQAGTPLKEIAAALNQEGQRLPFEPIDSQAMLALGGSPTVGGAFAANISGPRRIQVGAARDFLLGVRFVDGSGNILKSGGSVMKNVTGYDLVKLLAGSYGTLGVITQVAFKVLPIAETQSTLILEGLDDETAIDALTTAMNSPFDVSGAAHAPSEKQTYLRIEGFNESVLYRTEKLQAHLKKFGEAQVANASQSESLWSKIRNVDVFADKDADIWKLSVKPTAAPKIVSAIGFNQHLYDWSGGLIWGSLPKGSNPRQPLSKFGGHATRVRGKSGSIPKFQPQSPLVADLSEKIRSKFDPRGILNAGLMG
mgnify:FL=1